MVMDDSSKGQTVQVVNNFREKSPSLRIIRHPHRSGKGVVPKMDAVASKGDWGLFLYDNVHFESIKRILQGAKEENDILLVLGTSKVCVSKKWSSGSLNFSKMFSLLLRLFCQKSRNFGSVNNVRAVGF
jgi:hypothetical protein